MNREDSNNANWKGGISKFRRADDLLVMDDVAQCEVLNRLAAYSENLRGCWVWTGPVFKKNGRARLVLGKNNHLAYRLMYVLVKGPTGGLCVLHTCDNPLCVNPDHLFLGTNRDNSLDMVDKGRQASGARNGAAKLTDDQVKSIRSFIELHGLRGNRQMLSQKYHVNPETISRIAGRRSWRC